MVWFDVGFTGIEYRTSYVIGKWHIGDDHIHNGVEENIGHCDQKNNRWETKRAWELQVQAGLHGHDRSSNIDYQMNHLT